MIPDASRCRVDIAIGGIVLGIHTSDRAFADVLEQRYAGFIGSPSAPDYEFEVELSSPDGLSPDADVCVSRDGVLWRLQRGDFRAEWNPVTRRGHVRQSANPYSIDSVLRIVHTLVLAREGGFLVHSASAVRNGRAHLFAGVSGAGKTTISRHAPADANLLSDEISYVRKESDGYFAFGTPFAGELARSGENLRAPVSGVYLLAQGAENRIETVGPADAIRGMLANILFFAQDTELVQSVFRSAVEFVERVPVRRLTFMPDARVWDLIQ